MTETPQQQPQTRAPLWMKIGLALSLALNLAIAGLIAGFLMRGPLPVAGAGPGGSFGLTYLIALDREDRRAVMRTVRDAPDLPNRRARRQHFDQMAAALRADPLDHAQIEAMLMLQSDAVDQVQSVAQRAWLDRVSNMSLAERQAYADRIEEVVKRGPGRKKKGSKPD